MNIDKMITPLKFWCYKIIPLVYDDSLSYLECLAKMRDKINEVIKNTNEIPEYIDQKIKESFDDEHIRELISEIFRTIEDAITANNEGTNTNFENDYEIGELLWHDNKLYRAKRHIDAGDTVIVDTNIELASLGDMFDEFITEVKTNFTDNDDGLRETSSIDRPAHDLVWLNNVLYEVIRPIAEGNAYIYSGANKNVEQTNLDKIYDYLLDLISSEIDAREDADNTLQDNIDSEAQTRSEADITLRGNIDSEAQTRSEADITLQDNIDSEAQTRSEADITLQGNIISEAQTRNEADIALQKNIDNLRIKNALNYNVKGDGVTDDTVALQNWLNDLFNGDVGYLPKGTYIISNTLNVPNEDNITILGTHNSIISCSFAGGDIIVCGGATRHKNLTIDGLKIVSTVLKTSGAALHIIGYKNKATIKNIYIGDYGSNVNNLYDGIIFEHTNVTLFDTFSINCQHDGILVHGGSGNTEPDSSDLFLNNGFVIDAVNQLHLAGGFGGLYVANTLLFGGSNGLLVDNSYCNQGNREVMLSNTVCIDGCDNCLILLNETISMGMYFNTNAFLSGAGYYADPSIQQYACNIKIQSLPYGTVNIANCTIKASTKNGVWIGDTTTHVYIADSANICYNDVGVNNPNNSTLVYCNGMVVNNTTNYYGNYAPSERPMEQPKIYHNGDVLYNSGEGKLQYYNNGVWTDVT